jgi:hypothetical protein
MTEENSFETWAIVEIFGHQVVVGKVTEQTIGGKGMLRVDVPQTEDKQSFTKFYGMDAVYCITPVDEKTAIAAAQQFSSRPYDVLRLRLPELADRCKEGEEWDDDAGF